MILHGYDYRLSMRTGKTTYMATRAIIFKASINDIVIVCLMSTYSVDTIVATMSTGRFGKLPLEKFCLASRNVATCAILTL